MKRLLCWLRGHRPYVQWVWQSRRMRGLQAVARCRTCGKDWGEPEVVPLQRKIRR